MLEVYTDSSFVNTKFDLKSSKQNDLVRDFSQLIFGEENPEVDSALTKEWPKSSCESLFFEFKKNKDLPDGGGKNVLLNNQAYQFKLFSDNNYNANLTGNDGLNFKIGFSLYNVTKSRLYTYKLAATGHLEQVSKTESNLLFYTKFEHVDRYYKMDLAIKSNNTKSVNRDYASINKKQGHTFRNMSACNYDFFSIPKNSKSNTLSLNQYSKCLTFQCYNLLPFKKVTYLKQVDGNVKVILRDYRIDQDCMEDWYNKIKSELKPHSEYLLNGVNYPIYSNSTNNGDVHEC